MTFPAGEIVKIHVFGNSAMIFQQTGGGASVWREQIVSIFSSIGERILALHKYGSAESKEQALENIQRVFGFTRNDLLFVLASLNPSDRRDDHTHLEDLGRLADLHGLDRDKKPLQAIQAERLLREVGSKIFYEKFGKDRHNKKFDAMIDGKKVEVEIHPGSHGSWDFDIGAEIEGKMLGMRWTSMSDGPFYVNGNNYHDAEFLTFFDKKSPEFLFNFLMMELPDQMEQEE